MMRPVSANFIIKGEFMNIVNFGNYLGMIMVLTNRGVFTENCKVMVNCGA